MSREKKLNLSQNNHFSVTFNKIPKINQMLQRVDTPSVSINPTQVPYQGAVIKASTGSIRFGPLNFSLRIDEDHDLVHDIYGWMGLMHAQEDLGVPNEIDLKDYKEDIMVTYLNNNYTPIFEYNYVGCVPSSFDIDPSQRGTSEVLLANLSVEFDYFTIKSLK